MRKFLWQRINLKRLTNIKKYGYKVGEEHCEKGKETEYDNKGCEEDAKNRD